MQEEKKCMNSVGLNNLETRNNRNVLCKQVNCMIWDMNRHLTNYVIARQKVTDRQEDQTGMAELDDKEFEEVWTGSKG